MDGKRLVAKSSARAVGSGDGLWRGEQGRSRVDGRVCTLGRGQSVVGTVGQRGRFVDRDGLTERRAWWV